MKKSSFLRSSKDMLTKSFNSPKCKTSLKLASSRLKLLRNKKEVQVKQMKRELAQLLDSGQDRTARIRVEHVIREEKMMAAYDLIEIYCELIVARLPIIESQKNCPIDLKEAITSVVFASPRCGDIPELVDVLKHLTAKYGKEFISAAVELRPDCGVSRMLVEKLSAKAPDTQTKIKVLGAIAEEHGVKWDPISVEEAVAPNDLLNGPSTLKKASYIHEDPPNLEASPNASSNSPEELARSQNSVSAHGDGRGMASSSYHHLGGSPSGFRDERSEVGQSFSGGQNWNMEFKDATSAAQAAAESAERASLAARAAAQLSRQHSSESQRSQVLSSGGRGPRMYGTSSPHEHFPKDSSTSYSSPRPHDDTIDISRHDNLSKVKNQFHDDSHATSACRGPGNHGISSIHEQYPKDSATSSSPDRNSRFQNKRADDLPHDHLASATRHRNDSHATSDRPQVSSGLINNSFAKPEDGDRYMQNSLSKEESRKMMNPSGGSEAESMSSSEDESTENLNYFGEATTTKEPKFNSTDSAFGESIPHSNHQSFGYGSANDPFNGGNKGDIPSETVKKSIHDSGSVAFDDSGSEDYDIIKFDSDPVYDDQRAKLYFPSPDRKSPTHKSAIKNSWSFDSDKSQEKSAVSSNTPQLSESLTLSSDKLRPENVVPTFDDSESDSELVHPPNGRSKVFHTVYDEHAWNGDVNEWSHSLSDRLVSSDVPRHDKSESINSSSEDEAKHTKSREGKDNIFNGAQTNSASLPSSDSGFEKELEFEKLSGGLKHRGHIPPPYTRSQLSRGHIPPPYTRSQLNNVSSSVERSKENPVAKSQAITPPKTSIGFGMKTDGNKSSSRSYFASDTDTSDEELSRETATYAQKTGSEVNKKYAGLRGSNTYFDSDSSDSEAGPKKQSPSVRSRFSRRTKANSSSAHAKSLSRAAVNSNSGIDRSMAETQEPQKPLRDSFVADAQEPQRFVRKSYTSESNKTPSDRRVSPEQSASSSAASKPTSLEESGKSARAEQPSSSVQKAPTSSADKFSREDSLKKATHVHPKLPDYEDIAARLQSLRTNPK